MDFAVAVPLGHAVASGPPWRGALGILGPYPYGPRAGAPDNCLFLDELDVVDADTAARALGDYLSRGYNETMCGPAVANAYHGQYPDTDWRGRPEEYAAALTTRFAGLRRTLAVLPDFAPWFDGHAYNWDLIERDLTPLYAHPAVQAAVDDVQTAWETAVSIAEFAKVAQYCVRTFPGKRANWHNPVGHLSPALSSEDEQEAWRSAARHGIRGLNLQAQPPSSTLDSGRTPYQQMLYDLWDMQRRFLGHCDPPPELAHEHLDGRSPWGAPILDVDGQPLELRYREGVTFDLYWSATPESVAIAWGSGALTVPGVTYLGDGGPA